MKNILITGMAGTGKSTIGKRLAEVTGKKFIDFDELLEEKSGKSVGYLLRFLGEEKFISYEKEIALGIKEQDTIISLSGSVCLLDEAMEYLKQNGVAIFIDTPIEVISTRLKIMKVDRIIGMDDMTIEQIYEKRLPLYKKHADYTFENHSTKNAMGVFIDFMTFFKKLDIQ